MSKHQSAGAIAQISRIEALEKGHADLSRRTDALLVIIEKQAEQLNKLTETKTDSYKPAFDRWPSTER